MPSKYYKYDPSARTQVVTSYLVQSSIDQFRRIESHRVHTRKDFLLHENWLAESARARERELVTFDENRRAARTGGEKGRHLWRRLVQKITEGKTFYELSWKLRVIMGKNMTYINDLIVAVAEQQSKESRSGKIRSRHWLFRMTSWGYQKHPKDCRNK